jgi:hypothetical protein
LEHWGPLLQTVLWVLLITVILWRYHDPIHGILTALQKRIESGSTVKIGQIELIQPQTAQQQTEKLTTEVVEAIQAEQVGYAAEDAPEYVVEPNPLLAAPRQESSLTAIRRQIELTNDSAVQDRLRKDERALLTRLATEAENLAIKKLQTNVRVPINRNVNVGEYFPADGAYIENGRVTAIEVRFISVAKTAAYQIRRAFEALQTRMSRSKVSNLDIILALVVEREADMIALIAATNSNPRSQPYNVRIETFSLESLRKDFGIS